MSRIFALAALLFAFPAQAVVTIDWVTVGGAGNVADTTGFGSVSYVYRISKQETTNAQYAEFLNAVADTDTHALYDTNMGNPSPGSLGHGGITRSGSSGSFSYSTIAGRGNMPVNWVSFFDSLRFANWLHNGQPAGAQDSTTTEDGAYDLSLGSSVVRKAGAKVFVTSEDEWYKAAYYDTGAMLYFDYPAGTDTQTVCASPGATTNTANCGSLIGDLTNVGSYTASASPNGTFGQGGNVWDWNEAIISGTNRGLRGGGFNFGPSLNAASVRGDDTPTLEFFNLSFRVGSPNPSTPIPSLNPLGIAGLCSLLGLAGLHRLRG